MRFSTEVLEYLRRSGWQEGRTVKLSALHRYIHAHEKISLPFSEVARRSLIEFGDLCVRFPNKKVLHAVETGQVSKSLSHDMDAVETRLCFDPATALDCLNPTWIHDYRRTLGQPLSVVAWIEAEQTVVMLTPSGVVYMGSSEWLWKIADTLEEGIEWIVNCGVIQKTIPLQSEGGKESGIRK